MIPHFIRSIRWPFVSRSRYERELGQLNHAYSTSTSDLRGRLHSLIAKVVHVRSYPYDAHETEVAIKVQLPRRAREDYFLSPLEREEYWWHVGQEITTQLKAHAMLRESI